MELTFSQEQLDKIVGGLITDFDKPNFKPK